MATVRVTEKTRAVLRALARERDIPIHEVEERAVELYRRHQVLEATNEAYAALRADSAAWEELEAEHRLWDVTLADGLEA